MSFVQLNLNRYGIYFNTISVFLFGRVGIYHKFALLTYSTRSGILRFTRNDLGWFGWVKLEVDLWFLKILGRIWSR